MWSSKKWFRDVVTGTGSGRLGAATSPLRDGALDIVNDRAPVEFLDGAMAMGILLLLWVREDR
jgi:hypothetical protein